MTQHFVLDWNASPTIVGHVVDPGATSLANRWTRGRLVEATEVSSDLQVQVDSEPGGPYPDFFTLQQIPIVSDRLLQAMRGAGADNFEAHPIPIVSPNGTVDGHHLLNIVGRVACLDKAEAEVSYIDEGVDIVLRMKKLAIDPQRVGDLDLFRLDEFELLILVSERVQSSLEGLTGVSLLPAAGWSDSVWF